MGDFATREDMRELGRDIVAQMNRRFDEQKDWSDQRHSENLERLDFLGAQTAKTNGRVSVLESAMKALQEEFQAIRTRWHNFRDSLSDTVAKALRPETWDNRPLSWRELAAIATMLVAACTIAVTITMWLMNRH